ncbi:MAG: NAD(P)/FAD-dependent oxidoreductase [Anaerolineae bacterium]|jgi:flavin-dependent dehydrogenase|nr:NAD(P)/FAD-dependent oxidoreductase [Anaerolineae bacterium]
MRPDYDVIIVGGRPAGSTLAARLGKQGLRVLMLERSTFPELPAVSCPMINASTMDMLDEIGADESAYARGTPKIRRVVQALGAGLTLPFDWPAYKGRDYAYAIDRARFDEALWHTALSYPSVQGRQDFNVTDILVEDGRVRGVVGMGADKQTVRLTATLTVGADGRYSTLARKVGAQERHRHEEHPTSTLYAYWKGVRAYDDSGDAMAAAYGGNAGLGYLLMDSADGTTAVVVEGRADRFEGQPDSGEALYLRLLRENPEVWARVDGAERITTVRGMKRIGNLYRQAGGAGWALVGDAVVQQDPLDGQGIYNAVYTAKSLAWAIRDWRAGNKTWDEAVEWYDDTVMARTFGMYRQLLDRVEASLYTELPQETAAMLARWTLDDPLLKEVMGKFITRQIPAEAMRFITPGLLVSSVVRGGLRDLRQRLTGR